MIIMYSILPFSPLLKITINAVYKSFTAAKI